MPAILGCHEVLCLGTHKNKQMSPGWHDPAWGGGGITGHKGCFINEKQATAMLSWIRLCSLCLDMLRKGLADDKVLQLHHLILEQHRVVKDESFAFLDFS
jgi:hypothetical protein